MLKLNVEPNVERVEQFIDDGYCNETKIMVERQSNAKISESTSFNKNKKIFQKGIDKQIDEARTSVYNWQNINELILNTQLYDKLILARNDMIKDALEDPDTYNLLVSAATKSMIGNFFNNVVFNKIRCAKLPDYFVCKREEHHPFYTTSTRPDITVFDPKQKKLFVIYNQVALWGGGHQNDRADSYLNMETPPNVKIVCVVLRRPPTIKSSKSKTFITFKTGIMRKNLFYIKNLVPAITEFFGLNQTVYSGAQ